jgi:DHA1 family bicyclomycin/chloramphenicol resistance-like MFS transporter
MNCQSSQKSNGEFVALMALLMSLVALTIDAMLPALGQIGASLEVQNPNDVQFVISIVFLGMAMGLMLYGPLSDSYGRKNAIYLGMSFFLTGSLVSFFSTNLTVMLVGRGLQGFGAASCRVITLAMVRDKFEGREMGRIMSLIMVIFILVPALAPSIGQAILFVKGWYAIFGLFFILGLSGLLWLYFRQPETLPIDKRLEFSLSTIIAGTVETLKHPVARGYMIASGLIFGAFVGYLSSSQQILQIQYKLGNLFSIYFGCLALVIGFSLFVNSRVVLKFGMEKPCFIALIVLSVTSSLFYFYAQSILGDPTLYLFTGYLLITFFCIGILFGNFNALAVEPLGHIAGVATSVISFVQALLAVVLGSAVGQLYDGTVVPLVLGFLIFGVLSLAITVRTNRRVKFNTSMKVNEA